MLELRTLNHQVGYSKLRPSSSRMEASAYFARSFVQDGGGVGDGGIDFAAGEVALHGRDELREGFVGLRHEVGDEQDGEGRGFGEGVFLEVVVAGEFAGEQGILLAHLGLDEGVADAALVGLAAAFEDDFLDGPGGAQVVEDVGAGICLEDGAGDESRDHVHGDDVALFVEEADAVGIAVEAGGEIVLAGADGFLGSRRGFGCRGDWPRGWGRCRRGCRRAG